MSQSVVIGTSPFMDTSVAVGPFRSPAQTAKAVDDLEWKGWNVEVCELWTTDEVGIVAPPEE